MFNDYNFVIGGHSLGGGMTTLLTFLMLIHPPSFLKKNPQRTFKAFSYGGASVLSNEFSDIFGDVLKSVICGNDLIPRLSYASVQEICKMMIGLQNLQVTFFKKNIIRCVEGRS